jgi:hypothetical protein
MRPFPTEEHSLFVEHLLGSCVVAVCGGSGGHRHMVPSQDPQVDGRVRRWHMSTQRTSLPHLQRLEIGSS